MDGRNEEQSDGRDMKKCPWCAEAIKREAIVCRYCGRDLPPSDNAAKTSSRGGGQPAVKQAGKSRYASPIIVMLMLLGAITFGRYTAMESADTTASDSYTASPVSQTSAPDVHVEATVDTPSVPDEAASRDVSSTAPELQEKLLRVTMDAKVAFGRASNELLQGATRPARKKAICSIMQPGDVNGWIGKVSELSTNSDGKGVFAVTIAEGVELHTWSNVFSDIFDETLIDPESPLYLELTKLKVGDTVRFSGRFFWLRRRLHPRDQSDTCGFNQRAVIPVPLFQG